jgi:predicted Rossmann fold nucleotide-binding protein DprA/Smf involved in DNA uptake
MTEFEKLIKAMDAEKLMRAVADGFKSLSQAIDSLATHIEDLTVKGPAKKKPARAAAKKARSAAPKTAAKKAKTVAAKTAAKKARSTAPKKDKKKAPAKKSGKPTAIDTVYGFIARARNGIDVESLVKKTGFDNKKVHNVIYKLKKQNKIKSVDRGRYEKI